MAIREAESRERAQGRLEAENARPRRRAAELAADRGELQTARSIRRRDGAVDPAHRLLAGTLTTSR
jgi:hypothetical protein